MGIRKLKKVKKKSVFWALLSTGLIPTLISVLVLCTVFLFVIVRSTRSVEEEKGANIAYQASAVLDHAFSEALSATRKVSESDWLHDQFISYCLSEIPLTSIQKSDAVTSLSRIVAEQSSCITRIALSYFMADTTEYSSTGVFENRVFYEIQYPNRLEYAYYPNAPEGISQITVGGKNYLLYSDNISIVANGQKRANINVFLNEEALFKEIDKVTGGLAVSCELTDLEGNRLVRLSGNPDYSGKCVTVSNVSAELPVICSVNIPYDEYHKATRQSMPILTLTLLLDLGLCIAVSLYYSRRTYKPLKETLERFGGDISEENEFQALNTIMDKAFEDKEAAQASLNAIYPVARQRVLRSFIDGSAFAGGRDELLVRCGIDFPYPIFNAATVCTSLSDVFDTTLENGLEIQMATLAMEGYVERACDGLNLAAYLYVHGSEQFSLVLNYCTEEDLKVFIHRLQEYCIHAGSGTEQAVFSAGIGEPVEEAKRIHTASDQADFALNYSSAGRRHGISYYRDAVKEAKVLFFFSHSEQMLLSRAISKGDYEETERIVQEVLHTNRSVSAPYSIGLLYASICSTMITMAQECGQDVQISEEPETPRTVAEIGERVFKLAGKICSDIQRRDSESVTEEDRKVLDYIDEHLYDPNLSLSTVAEVFNRSQAGISEAFKKLTGKKYIDYINEKRIRRAMELIYQEKLDMNKVYTRVGYISMSTFRRNYHRYAQSDRNRKE